ncbi:hypothetical protein [Parahaliea mediterranea]|uniref:hypothetical protein n=1 Tax=Parahaliea mediterranea TaxID=651086 RepID=UPI000E2E9233|nr:hypothetical protein [Parahaliea mediterranea]
MKKSVDAVQIAELLISQKLDIEELKKLTGLTKAQIKSILRDNAQEAANRLVSKAFTALDIPDPFLFNRQPEDRPTNWSSKYTPSAGTKKGSKISQAVAILKAHSDSGTLLRENRAEIVEEIANKLKLKNEMTASTYFADAKRLADVEYSG